LRETAPGAHFSESHIDHLPWFVEHVLW
jgi:hypothetical protein